MARWGALHVVLALLSSGLLVHYAVKYHWAALDTIAAIVGLCAFFVALVSLLRRVPFPPRYFAAVLSLCLFVSVVSATSVWVSQPQNDLDKPTGAGSAGEGSRGEPPSPDDEGQQEACLDPTTGFTTPWGPDRPLIERGTGTGPAFNNAMNHYRNSPSEDGRQAVIEANDAEFVGYGGYSVEQNVHDGGTYRVRMHPVNTGAPGNGQTAAQNVVARLVSPECASTQFRVVGTLTSSNAVPDVVWSSVTFRADRPFRMVLSERPSKACFPEVTGNCDNTFGFNQIPDVGRIFSSDGLPIGSSGFGGQFAGNSHVDMMIYLTPRFE